MFRFRNTVDLAEIWTAMEVPGERAQLLSRAGRDDLNIPIIQVMNNPGHANLLPALAREFAVTDALHVAPHNVAASHNYSFYCFAINSRESTGAVASAYCRAKRL